MTPDNVELLTRLSDAGVEMVILNLRPPLRVDHIERFARNVIPRA